MGNEIIKKQKIIPKKIFLQKIFKFPFIKGSLLVFLLLEKKFCFFKAAYQSRINKVFLHLVTKIMNLKSLELIFYCKPFLFFKILSLFYTYQFLFFRFQENFYIVRDHIFTFLLILLQEDLDTFHESFFVVFLGAF